MQIFCFAISLIGKQAFAFSGLSYITIPESVQYIDIEAFTGCFNMIFARIENPYIKMHKGADSVFLKSTVIKPWESMLSDIPVVIFCDNTEIGSNVYRLSDMKKFELVMAKE